MAEQRQRVRVGSDVLQGLVESLAEQLRRSVVIDDPLVRLVCSSQHFDDEDPVRIRSLLQGRADAEVIRYVLDLGVAQWTKPGFIEGRDDLGLLTRYCVPLRSRGHLVGLLMVVAPDGTLAPEETDKVAQATPAIAAQMYADELAAADQETEAQEALLALVGTNHAARETARQRIVDGGLLPETAHTVATVVQVSHSQEPPGQVELALRGALEKFRQTRSASGVIAVTADSAVLLQAHSRPVCDQQLTDQSLGIIDDLRTYLGAPAAPVLGVGGVQSGLAEAQTSYTQALVAARAARRMPQLRSVGVWSSLGEFAVLLQLPDHALEAGLLPKPLRALLESPSGSRLVETLRCFLEHAGSIPRTAEALQIHRTSLYYRLRQIQEITGLDLDSGGDRLVLHLGLRIQDLLEPQTG
ncbi:PucR family transcriptional regulator [Streptomyces sp. NPDC002519]